MKEALCDQLNALVAEDYDINLSSRMKDIEVYKNKHEKKRLEPNQDLIVYMKENHPEFSSYVEQASPKATKSIQNTASKSAKKDEEVIKESAKEVQTQALLNSDEAIEKGISKVTANPERAQFLKIFLTNLNKELRAKLQKEDSDKLKIYIPEEKNARIGSGDICYKINATILGIYINQGTTVRLEFKTKTNKLNEEILTYLKTIDNGSSMKKATKDKSKNYNDCNFNIMINVDSDNHSFSSSEKEIESAKELLRIIIENKKK